ncbi:hypothetical protein ATCC90586_006081 [Pythium insidiosum]|nr:hypothetical protein ATCC90586_006081 [Pythium insidiosum]
MARKLLACGHAVALLLMFLSMVIDRWRSARGLPGDEVAPDVVFQGLDVGNCATWVTLRRFNRAAGRWRTRETRYRSFLQEDEHPTIVLDLVTGEQLVLGHVCESDVDWTAERLGVPPRVPIAEMWDKQCTTAWATMFGFFLASLSGFAAIVLSFADEKHLGASQRWWAFVGVPFLPVAFFAVPTLLWTYVLTEDGILEPAISLRLAYVVLGLWVLCWAVGTGLYYAPTGQKLWPFQLRQIRDHCLHENERQPLRESTAVA